MLDETISPYLTDPDYRAALRSLQKGEWDAGLAQLDALLERYPLERDLRAWRQEAALRARVDQDERTDRTAARRRRTVGLVTRLVAVVVVLGAAAWAVSSFSGQLQQRAAYVQQLVTSARRQGELQVLERDARIWLRAGKPEEARAQLDKIAAIDPEYPALAELLALTDLQTTLETRYARAVQLLEQGEVAEAQGMFEAIESESPNYRDVPSRLAEIDKRLVLDRDLGRAETAFQAKDWVTAAAYYESVRALDPTYNTTQVEERLFQSYVGAAQAALADAPDLLKALQTAEDYFSKALVLRPLDAGIKTQRELAGLYLSAQANFAERRWSDVIADLEYVFAVDPAYALDTTRQTLYEAYAFRGDEFLAGGEYESALGDYQRAIEYAGQGDIANLRLYEAHLKAAEAHGGQGDYEESILHYRTAVELGKLKERNPQENPGLFIELETAEKNAAAGVFNLAYEHYRKAIRLASTTQATYLHSVQAGEYLILLASRYGSTVSAIVLANGLADPRLIYVGQELVIPVFK